MKGPMNCKAERTQKVGNIESGRTRLSDTGEIILAFRKFSRVDKFSHGEYNKLIEQGNDVASRLVDSEHHCAVVVSC